MENVVFTDESSMTVEIPKMEYRTLVEESINLDTLLRGLLQSAKLGYDKTDLTFNDRNINAILGAMFPEKYETRLTEVKQEKEEQS